MYKEPGKPHFLSGAGFEVNYDLRGLLQAALFMRRNAASHLRSLSVGDVEKALTDFMSSNFWIIGDEAWDGCLLGGGRKSDMAFSAFVSESTKKRLAEAIHASDLFVEPRQLFVFPLVVVSVAQSFDCSTFFFAEPAGLTLDRLPPGYSAADVRSESFPPFARRNGTDQSPSSWLGVWGPTKEVARRNRAAILGALALLPHRHERYLFTMRKVFGGFCVFDGSLTMVSSEPHTPALSENVLIESEDHSWLAVLAEKIISPVKADRRSIRALEYFYRAWVPDPTRRFPTLFGALDAIYGDAAKATQSVIEAVGPVMGAAYDYQRLKVLLGLRASVIHGGAPNVYESSDYHRYYERYEEDATRDLELIVARCLQAVIFGSAMQERPHTYAELFKRETGRDI
ncbi:hypothetical protein [Edaphosphingomonas haloaromaticamans]|uniref:Apea-like HEPN domain-containing protein n=1 Tax=Edaphosphingomonas haloaromaticamans TaxID=653954 RepID=A0A1S1HE33_9SPHN|nr:hypothetical protein [Sphingomonas haloaromaticamans]OHT20062.1 hypothetical protein BHE75_02056 [Sphingomonas haloaromaticamans]